MRSSCRILITALAMMLAACSGEPASEVAAYTPSRTDGPVFEPVATDDFALLDQNGDFHRLFYYTNSEAVALFVHGNGCPISRNSIPRLKELRAQFGDKVKFLLLNANSQDSRESIAEEAAGFDIDFPILVDETQLVAQSLGIERTAEVFLVDPNSRKIVYHGPVDDRLNFESQKTEASEHYLADAINAHLNGQPVLAASRAVPGCLVSLPADDEPQVTYTDHVGPIMKAKCQECHQAGGIAPWAMTGYEMVRGWAPMIREVVRTKRMPPWHADSHYGEFAHDLSLSKEETRTLVRWVEGGAARGEGEDPLTEPPAQVADWPLGEPDMIMALPEHRLPPTGLVDYKYHDVDIPLDDDVWLRGIDIKPGNNAVVHHILVSIDYPEDYDPPKYVVDYPTHVVMYMKATGANVDRLRWVFGIAGGYVPGVPSKFYPEGTGRKLPKGSSLRVQIHYTTTGREETDASQFGLYFQESAETEVFALSAVNFEMEVPPYAEHHELTAHYVMEDEGTIYDFIPHMHYRGKSMRIEAAYPDGRTETLLSVPNYDFNWQRTYVLQEPLHVPAGTEIRVRAAFDNSTQNIRNPDPSAELYFGEQTEEEMLIGYFSATFGPAPKRSVTVSQVPGAGH